MWTKGEVRSTKYKVQSAVALCLFSSSKGAIVNRMCRAPLSYVEGLGMRPGVQMLDAKQKIRAMHSLI